MEESTASLTDARVIAGHGRRFVVETEAGARLVCLTAGRSQQPVCGDLVRIRAVPDGGVIQDVLPRRSLFSKADTRGVAHPTAANLDQVLVVLAATPVPDDFLMDKYLAAIAGMHIRAGIVFNKLDIIDAAAHAGVMQRLDYLERLAYPVFKVSTRIGTGMTGLRQDLEGKISLLVGQSGVGKSSLLNALIPDLERRIDELTAATGEGRHTTTATSLHSLPGGGALMDSPGVRDLEVASHDAREVAGLFPELKERVTQCRFADCLHTREPGCAVKSALQDGLILASRYESYKRLVRTMQKATDNKYD